MKDLRNQTFNRILVVKLSAIGDVAMATPVARGLRDLYPEARIDWLVEPLSADVLRGNPFLNEVVVWDRQKAAHGLRGVLTFIREVKALRRRLHGHYDLALDIQGLGRSALATWASGAPFRVGKSDTREGGRVVLTHDFPVEEPTFRAAHQYTETLRFFGHPNPPDDLEMFPDEANRARADDLLAGLSAPNGMVSLTPATTRPYKHWTNAAFAETIDRLYDTFGFAAVLHGGPGDVAMAEEIAGRVRCAPTRIIAGQTTLRDAAEVIRRSRLLVGVDTGLMHFGIAMHTPTVAIFGPTNPHRLRDERYVTVLQKGGTRRADNVVNKREWWEDRSIDQNTPADVLEAARGLIGAPVVGGRIGGGPVASKPVGGGRA